MFDGRGMYDHIYLVKGPIQTLPVADVSQEKPQIGVFLKGVQLLKLPLFELVPAENNYLLRFVLFK